MSYAPDQSAPKDARADRRGRRTDPGFVAAALGFFAAIPTSLPAQGAPPDLRIQEALSSNHSGIRDESGERPDWIELLNPGTSAVDLAGWSLSDDAGKPRKWTFASGRLDPGGFRVVWASGEDRQPSFGSPRAPDQIPGLVVWLKADGLNPSDPNQIRRTANGAFVRLWRDASGSGRDARQDALGQQPRLVSEPSPAVVFDGQDDLLRLASPPAADSFTLLAVFRPTRSHEVDPRGFSGVGGTSGQAWLFGASHGGDQGAGMGISVGTNGVSLYEHGSSYMPAVATFEGSLAPSWNLVSAVYSNRIPGLVVDGNAITTEGQSPRTRVTAPTEIGSGNYGAFAGGVAEVLVYSRALSEEERVGVEAHLAARHGVPLAAAYHTNFRLDAGGERLVLTRPDGSRADDLRLPAMPRDVSWGRLRDDPGTFRFFAIPTPGAANPPQGATAFLVPPAFSRAAGFYSDSVDLNLATTDDGAEIRYTLDGSVPTEASPRFVESLRITNRTSLPNRLSAIPTAPGWSPPSGRVFKGTVVRARAFRSDAIPSETATASYFVHPRGSARFSLPVVSLASDERHFFDADTGIYVVGNAPGGNYAQTGDAWERPVHVEMFEPDGTRAIAQEAGIRMHGNTSFGFPVKALRLHASNQRGTGPFRHRIFPDLPIDSFERLLLRPSGHDHYLTMMRDGLMQGLVRELGLDIQGYRPAILFIDGEYWGIHNLQEAFEKQYFESHHPEVDADAVDYLEGYAPAAFSYEGDANAYHDLVRYLNSHAPASPETLAGVAERMETANYRDYKLAEIFYYRWDIGNHRL
ncbi:MAG: CotH kinase family protein, partial [Verrucomicrobiales bacterium]|nr:CotH kinase family protein [Verrucomicrobiales bacterium]